MKLIYVCALIGGILGLISHLIWHSLLGISLFAFSSHLIFAIIHTSIGIIIGSVIGFLVKKKF